MAGLLAVLAVVTASGLGLVTWKWRAEVAARTVAEAQIERSLDLARENRESSRSLGDAVADDWTWRHYLAAARGVESDVGLPGDGLEMIRRRVARSFYYRAKASQLAKPAQALEDPEEAGRALTNIASAHPDAPHYRSLRGRLHAARADVVERLERPAGVRAERRSALERYEEAIPDFHGEERGEAPAGRAELLMLEGMNPKANEDLKEAIRLAPRPA